MRLSWGILIILMIVLLYVLGCLLVPLTGDLMSAYLLGNSIGVACTLLFVLLFVERK